MLFDSRVQMTASIAPAFYPIIIGKKVNRVKDLVLPVSKQMLDANSAFTDFLLS